MPAHRPIIIAAALALAGMGASGQTVYRCGNSYSQQPCAGGTALDTEDRSSAGDAARARQAVAVDMKRAEALEKARLAQEKNAPKAVVIGPATPPAPEGKPVKDGTKPKAGKLEQFTATAPGPGKKPKKPNRKKAT